MRWLICSTELADSRGATKQLTGKGPLLLQIPQSWITLGLDRDVEAGEANKKRPASSADDGARGLSANSSRAMPRCLALAPPGTRAGYAAASASAASQAPNLLASTPRRGRQRVVPAGCRSCATARRRWARRQLVAVLSEGVGHPGRHWSSRPEGPPPSRPGFSWSIPLLPRSVTVPPVGFESLQQPTLPRVRLAAARSRRLRRECRARQLLSSPL